MVLGAFSVAAEGYLQITVPVQTFRRSRRFVPDLQEERRWCMRAAIALVSVATTNIASALTGGILVNRRVKAAKTTR